VHTEVTRSKVNIKPLAERNRLAVGATGIALIVAIVVAAFSYDRIPFIKGTSDYQAYFADAGGIKTGSDVRVSGLGVGRVSGIHLEGAKVRVDFTVHEGVELGDRTEAAIKTETVLGTKVLELTPRGDRNLDGPIPIERTTSPYDLPAALGDLTTTISGLDTTQLSSALKTLAQTFQNTPPDLKLALESVARFSDTLGTRDAKLRQLLADANKVTAVLAKRSDQIARLVVNTDALLGEILSQRNSVETLMANVSAATVQLSGLVNDNRTQLKPAVDKLNGVLGILDNRKKELQRTLYDGGFAGICYPKEYGGQGLSPEYQHAFTEESVPYEMPFLFNVPTLTIIALDRNGRELQRQTFDTSSTGTYPCEKPVDIGKGVMSCP